MKKIPLFKQLCLSALLPITSLVFTACDPEKAPAVPKGEYEKGVIILNEGNFQKGNSSVSFYNRDSKTVTHDIFTLVNARPLGDVAQSIAAHKDRAYMVVNNGNKIEVVDI